MANCTTTTPAQPAVERAMDTITNIYSPLWVTSSHNRLIDLHEWGWIIIERCGDLDMWHELTQVKQPWNINVMEDWWLVAGSLHVLLRFTPKQHVGNFECKASQMPNGVAKYVYFGADHNKCHTRMMIIIIPECSESYRNRNQGHRTSIAIIAQQSFMATWFGANGVGVQRRPITSA